MSDARLNRLNARIEKTEAKLRALQADRRRLLSEKKQERKKEAEHEKARRVTNILSLLAKGLTFAEVGRRLGLSGAVVGQTAFKAYRHVYRFSDAVAALTAAQLEKT